MSTPASDPILPDIPKGFDLPFYYGTFTNLGVDYLVDKGRAEALLKDFEPSGQLSVAEFEGKACLSFNYQVYFAQFAHGTGVTQETEFNIVAYPTAAASRVPKLTYKQYARGEDQTRNLGFCRHRVACDADPAIKAGKELFGEPKFKAGFAVTLPVPNGTPTDAPDPATGANAVWYDTWKVTCLKVDDDGEETEEAYFTFTADLRGLPAKTVSAAPFTEFGTRKVGGSDKALAAPLNVFQPYQWYDLEKQSKKVALTSGNSPDPKIKSFIDAIAATEPVGAWLYQSPPVAVQNRPYFLPTAP